jgi:hypothetical protein
MQAAGQEMTADLLPGSWTRPTQSWTEGADTYSRESKTPTEAKPAGRRREIRLPIEEWIDRGFEAMGRDEERRKEALELEAFWAPLSDEALRKRLEELGDEGGF